MHGAVLQLASGALDAAAVALEATSLAHGIDVMVQITNDMLDAEALRLGRLRIRPAPTDIRTVLAACAKADESVAVALDVASNVPASVMVDALRFRQVLAGVPVPAFVLRDVCASEFVFHSFACAGTRRVRRVRV